MTENSISLRAYRQGEDRILAIAPSLDNEAVLVPSDEVMDFIKDLAWFDAKSFADGSFFYQECTISIDDWNSWSDELEVNLNGGQTAIGLGPAVDLDQIADEYVPFSQVTEGEHFEVCRLYGLHHWESSHDYPDNKGLTDTIGCEVGFEHRIDAVSDAKNIISVISAYGTDDGFSLIDHYDLMMSRMWVCDVELIENAIACLPIDNRGVAAYRMALRTKLMPKQYWS